MAEFKASKQEIESVRDLFGLCHDLIAQSQFPGHVHEKVQQAMKFLAWQYNDFKARADAAAKAEEAVANIEVVGTKPAIPVEGQTKDAAELAGTESPKA